MQTDIMINTVIVNCRKLEETKRQTKNHFLESLINERDQRLMRGIDQDRSGGISR